MHHVPRSRKAPFNCGALLILNLTLLLFTSCNVECNIASTTSEESSNELIVYSACNMEKYANGSAFERNLEKLFYILIRNALFTAFNASAYGAGTSQVFGRLQCRADLSLRNCHACALYSLYSIRRECPNALGARVQLDDCFLRYENYDFLSKLDTNLWYRLISDNNVGDPRFRVAVRNLMVDLSAIVTSSSYKFAVGTTTVNFSPRNSSTIYGMEMCWRDMSAHDCAACLSRGLEDMFSCCSERAGVQVFFGSCSLRYEVYAFDKYS